MSCYAVAAASVPPGHIHFSEGRILLGRSCCIHSAEGSAASTNKKVQLWWGGVFVKYATRMELVVCLDVRRISCKYLPLHVVYSTSMS